MREEILAPDEILHTAGKIVVILAVVAEQGAEQRGKCRKIEIIEKTNYTVGRVRKFKYKQLSTRA